MSAPVSVPPIALRFPEGVLALLVPPLLTGLVVSRVAAVQIQKAGVWSEEIFRGDRLPALPFPSATAENPDPSPSSSQS